MNNNTENHKNPEAAGQIITINEEGVRSELGALVRQTVEETLNIMLDAEADELCKASKYEERSAERASTRAGHYTRMLHATAGSLKLKVPRLRNVPFETAIIERYKRREASSVTTNFRRSIDAGSRQAQAHNDVEVGLRSIHEHGSVVRYGER